MVEMKGITDIIFIILLLVTVGFVVLFAGVLLTELKPLFGNASLNTSITDRGLDAINAWNIGFIFLVVGAGIALILSAFLIRTHPAFLIVSFISLGIIVLVAAIMGNFFDDIATADLFVDRANEYTTITTLMRNLPTITIILGGIFLAILYGKTRSQDGV